ncbi:hypothetical protein THRCLA_08073 [Thraustotheca clavata]|uniref:RING-type E3 ubiquitin transferase n=1 Tax=Thraustotheca clavata TaxID=74557 RepID=A0A1V9ZA52_9STRA|nr:hypothetical protein THRCLA_08073 [Thraustotheca clavata]
MNEVDVDERKPKANKKNKSRARKQKNKTVEKDSVNKEDVEDNEEEECCLVCAEPFTFHAIGECNHAGICSLCSMRMRVLMKDMNCPICKQNMPRVIVTNKVEPYASFGIWGETGGPGVTFDERSEMFFSQCPEHYEQLVAIRTLNCRLCPKSKTPLIPQFRNLEELESHMTHAHKVSFCGLCLQYQHFYPHEQALYTKGQLKTHNSQINRQNSTQKFREYHPLCEFCQRRYYSDVELYAHLEQDHFKCHLCNAGHRYYRNYAGLESHFRKEHHLCEYPTCLANRFIVFGNEFDYQAHMVGLHGADPRVQINFRSSHETDTNHTDIWDYERAAHETQQTALNQFPALPTPAVPLTPITPPPVALRPTPAAPVRENAPRTSVNRNILSRNEQLAAALGRGAQSAEALEQEMQPKYSQELQEWGRTKFRTLCTIERQIEAMLADRRTFSLHLKAMPRDHRRMMHELASQAQDVEPRRFISLIKQPNSAVPLVTLSQFLKGPQTKPRVRPARVVIEQNARLPVGRGWESLPPPPPAIEDAWSEEEEEQLVNPDAVTTEGSTVLEFLHRHDVANSDTEMKDEEALL